MEGSEDISTDHLHPNDLGHQLVAGVITHLLDKIYQDFLREKEIIVTNEVEDKEFYLASIILV